MGKYDLVLIITVVLSGFQLACDSDTGSDGNNADSSHGNVDTEASDSLEIATWWTAPGEAEALLALIDVYREKYPNVSIIDVVGSLGHEADSYAVVEERIAANEPPDIFQVNPARWADWIEFGGDPNDNRLVSLDDIYDEEGWTDKFPSLVINSVTYTDGHKYGVLTGLHRANTLFFNNELVPEPPSTLAELLALAESLENDGVTPLAISGVSWPLNMFFEVILAASTGPEFYHAYINGELDLSDSQNAAVVEKAIDDFLEISKHTIADESITWEDAAEQVLEGEAAMTIHGDWIKGYMQSLGARPGVDFDAVAMPGTRTLYAYLIDGLSMCANLPNPLNARNFIHVVGSPEGQAAFNQVKGSIPVHPDVDFSDLDPVTQATLQDFQNATVLHDWIRHHHRDTSSVANGLFYGTMDRDEALTTLSKLGDSGEGYGK